MTQPNPAPEDVPQDDMDAAQQAAAPAGDAAPAADAPDARVAALEQKLAETQDKMLRALAEAQNVRQRAEKAQQDMAKYAISGFARELLGAVDNLRRALEAVTPEARGANAELNNVLVGVEATERELLRALENAGVRRIDAQGKAFDPNLHEVMFESPSDQPAGTILQVLETGYTIHDRLLRPARVGVAKNDGGTETGGQVDAEA